MTTNIKDYSTTQASNTTLNTINVAEGMLPSNLNNAIRALMKNTRDWFNESQWIEYGDGSGTPVITYVSATSFKVTGDNSTAHYVANRRVKVTGSATGTIYGTISSSAFDSVDATTVVVVWDSGQLSSEVLRVYSGILTPTNTSIPSGIIVTANIADGSVTTPKLADDAVTNAKVATNAITAPELATNAVTEAKISDSQVTTVKLADNAVTTVKITDDNVTTAKIADNAVTTAKITNSNVTADKLASDSVTTAKILNANVTTDKIADNNVTTAKILNSNVTTAKIADDAITAAKIADAVLITASEQSTSTPDDVTVFTTSAANNRFFNVDSSETINSGQVWSDSDSYIATTAAITNRIIDLVDDVGGFVPIASYTKFPNTNPDPNDGTGTVVSITDMTSFTYNTGTGVSTNSTTVGGTAVTITGIPATIGSPITVAYGLLVETTTTLNTYTFVRLVPIATEVNTVASISGNITTVANNTSNINSVAGNATNINKVATIDSNVTTVAGIAANVTTVAGDTANIATVAGNATNINLVGNNITNVNNVGGSITNVNTVATNIVDVNSFADTYFISGTAPSSPTTGDLWFDTSASTMKVYSGSGWQNAGSSVNGTSARFQYTVSGTPTTVSGTDDNGNTLAYDAGYVDVYLNGLKMLNGTDVTVTSGTSVVFASALQGSDIVDIIAYGTFNVAAINASNITSGTLNNARLSSIPNSALANSSVTINGATVSLGGSTTIPTEIKPTISGINPDTILPNVETSIVITGTNFASVPEVEAVNATTGARIIAHEVAFTSSTSLTVKFTIATLGNYRISIVNPDGNAALSGSLLTVSTGVSWTTASGSLGTFGGGSAISVTVVATSDSTITYSILSGALPGGLSLNSSTGVISGTETGSSADTTFNFTIRATDVELQVADRAFSISLTFAINNSGQFN